MNRLELPDHDVVGIRAGNPGPFTLSGTNTWIAGRDPAWVIDPGPSLPEHLRAVEAEVTSRGGAAGILLSHDHADHYEAAPELSRRLEVKVFGARGGEEPIVAGQRLGPFDVLATPGHSVDHLSFVMGDVLFSGDAILGEGSVFVYPDPGALRGYLDALARLRELPLSVLCPAHGPVVTRVRPLIEQYFDHRLDRERRVVAALEAGARSVEALLDAAWPEVPENLRIAAAVTLAAHLDKLSEEGRLPADVERPKLPF